MEPGRQHFTSAQTALHSNLVHSTATVRLPTGAAPLPLLLTDALGRKVRRYLVPAGAETTLDRRGLPASLCRLHDNAGSQRLTVE